MLLKFYQIVNRLYAFIYETNHSKSGLGLPSIIALDVAQSHGGDDGSGDRPPPHHVPIGCEGCFANRGPEGEKGGVITDIGTQFDLRPHMESPDWTEIDTGIQQHLQKTSGGHVPRPLRRKTGISIFSFGMILGTLPEPLKIGKTGQSTQSYLDRDPGRLLAFEMRWQSSATQDYPSLIDTFFVAHTVNGVFTRDKDRLIYEEMRRLEATSTYTDDEINRLARRGKQRGHSSVSIGYCQHGSQPAQFESAGASGSDGSGGCGNDEESANDQEDEDEDGDGDS
nr:hypothetical protein [Tanacetum cinerariifolium]